MLVRVLMRRHMVGSVRRSRHKNIRVLLSLSDRRRRCRIRLLMTLNRALLEVTLDGFAMKSIK